MSDDAILRQYLLGRLDDEQADDLERRLLTDGELFVLAEAVEGDLLMAAARGELSPAERGRVLRRLASSPEGQMRYSVIRGLTSFDREQVPAEVRVLQLLARPGIRAAALAASLAVMAGGFWLATQTAMPRSANMIAEGLPAASEIRPERLILQLALTSLRSSGQGTPRLEIPAEARQVEIRLPLLPEEPATSLTAILRNASTGEEIRHEERLAARELNGEKMILLTVPAADLAPGTYEIEVRSTEGELLGRPMFEIG